jgi:hypothetical protein
MLKYASGMSSARAKVLLFGVIILGIIGIGIFESRRSPTLDERVRTPLRELGLDRTYAMKVETHTILGDRELFIEGIYRIDAPAESYASEATTTLRILETGETHAFSLRNVSLGDTVYVSVSTESPLLSRTLPLTEGWRSFESAAIPAAFVGIAVHGPILDTALLFGEDVAHLEFVEKREGEGRYTFKLAEPDARKGGALQTIFERVGENGRINVFFKDERVSHFVLSGSEYTSTTTLIRETSRILPPL